LAAGWPDLRRESYATPFFQEVGETIKGLAAGTTKELDMERFTLTIPMLTLLLLASLAAVGQEKQGPDLKTTVEFMNRMVEPEHRIVSMANQCELEIVNNEAFTFYLPDGTTGSKGRASAAHTEFTFAEIEDAFLAERFKLSDVDPSSIKSLGAASSEFIAKHHPVQPADLETPDITLMNFGTVDRKKSIEVGGLKDSGRGDGTKTFNKTGDISSWLFVFKSKDRAERFVTAFVHAVKLCGGKPADFPPTPTEKP
jgi:hypothetical protein